MKNIILSVILTMLITLSGLLNAQPLTMPYLRLEFNGNANDQSGNANHGVVKGNPVYVNDRFNIAQSAIHLDGDEDMIELANGMIHNSANITVSCWIRTQDVHGVILGYQNTQATPSLSPSQYVLPVYVDNSGRLSGKLWDGILPNVHTGSSYINDEQWHHIALVCDSISQKMYLDNVLIYSYTNSHVKLANCIYNQIGAGYASGLWNGVNNYWSFYTGSIDDFRIYKRALTQTEISALYNNTTGLNSIVAKSNQIEVYPNPSGYEFHVKLPFNQKCLSVQLLGTEGSFNGYVNFIQKDDLMTLSAAGLEEGVYVLKLKTNNSTFYEKVVIKR